MQGRKEFQPKLLYTATIDHLVPKDNYYRKLGHHLDLNWIYKATAKYYGSEGQESIDPVVFFKMCLVGYLNGLTSDRKLAEECSMRLDVRLFLGYDIDESLPWHSTISRTRQLYGEELFVKLFNDLVKMCIEKGMVSGHTQAIDSALVKANASIDSLEAKEVTATIEDHLQDCLRTNNRPDRKAKINRAPEEQQKMTGDDESQKKQLEELNTRYKRQANDYKEHQPVIPDGKYLSNKTHYSPVDPDSRIAVKPGKPRNLYYFGQMSVDASNHVITHMQASHADGRDGKDLQEIVTKTQERLLKEGLTISKVLADAGYSSGENYKFLEDRKITGYIPLLGGALISSEGFTYDKARDVYICPNNKILKGKGEDVDDGKGHAVRKYFSLKSDCMKCPLQQKCLGPKMQYKKVQHSIYKEQLDAAKARQKSLRGKMMKRKRSATVEPVWGTLINYLGLRKLNARGIQQANKIMLMAATVYNLKKLMKYISKKQNSGVLQLKQTAEQTLQDLFSFIYTLMFPETFRAGNREEGSFYKIY